MDNQMVEVLNSIRFAERYQALRTQYSFDAKESFENYDNQYVLEMLQGLQQIIHLIHLRSLS